jgi:hypothetical protein
MTPTEFKDYLLAFLVFAFRLAVILAVAALIGSIFVSVSAAAVECRERPDRTTYWSYRIIDGDRCWYKGHRVISKSQLYWPDKKEEKPKREIRDPVFHIRAEAAKAKVKTVDPNEFNELDAQADNKIIPFLTFPDLSAKVDALLNWWTHRWDDDTRR